MVLVISQETFESAVKENMSEFSMSLQEAIEDAVNQFKAQSIREANRLDGLIRKFGVSTPCPTGVLLNENVYDKNNL